MTEPEEKVTPSEPTDEPQGDTESRLEHVDEDDHITPEQVKREQGKK